MEKTKVIFRKYPDGDIIAIFPEEPGDSNKSTCLSYMHMGQHSACDPYLVISETFPASSEEYKDLRNELEVSVGYDLEVYARYTINHVKARNEK